MVKKGCTISKIWGFMKFMKLSLMNLQHSEDLGHLTNKIRTIRHAWSTLDVYLEPECTKGKVPSVCLTVQQPSLLQAKATTAQSGWLQDPQEPPKLSYSLKMLSSVSPTQMKYEELKASLPSQRNRLSYQNVTWQHKLSLTQKHQFYIALSTTRQSPGWGKSPITNNIPSSISAHSRPSLTACISLILKPYQQKCS